MSIATPFFFGGGVRAFKLPPIFEMHYVQVSMYLRRRANSHDLFFLQNSFLKNFERCFPVDPFVVKDPNRSGTNLKPENAVISKT